MWPTCIDKLKPFRRQLQEDIPDELLKAFEEAGWPELPQSFPVKMVALLGTCSTDQYKECPTLPEWHIENAEYEGGDEYLEDVGKYFWCDFDLIDNSGSHIPLRIVFNEGDADCNDWTWGMVWDRNTATPVVELTSVGDCEGCVKLVSDHEQHGYRPHSHPIPDDNESLEACRLPFFLVYGSDSEIEKLIGIAMRWSISYSRT